MKTIFISGAAGFIGSHLCDFFLKKNFKVIGIDNFLTGSIENIQHNFKNKNFDFIEHDIRNKISIDIRLDYIMHFASPASPVDYLKYPIETLQIGSRGTENMLNLAFDHKATILVASTSEVYGDPLEHPQKESYFGNVNTIGPRGVYDESKRYLESITTAFKNNKNLSIRIARIFNTYGPRMRINDGRVIPNFINQSLRNKPITIYGDGQQTRSFCYIDDAIEGLYRLLESNYQKPMNIGNPNEYSILQLADKIQTKNLNHRKYEFFSLPENDPKVRRPDISLAKNVLNWQPKFDLEQGLEMTIEYFKNLYHN